MKISAFSLVLRTREKYWFFHHTRWNIFGIPLKKVNILYLVTVEPGLCHKKKDKLNETTHFFLTIDQKKLNVSDVSNNPYLAHIFRPENVCFLHLLHFWLYFTMEANTMNPDQTDPRGKARKELMRCLDIQ